MRVADSRFVCIGMAGPAPRSGVARALPGVTALARASSLGPRHAPPYGSAAERPGPAATAAPGQAAEPRPVAEALAFVPITASGPDASAGDAPMRPAAWHWDARLDAEALAVIYARMAGEGASPGSHVDVFA